MSDQNVQQSTTPSVDSKQLPATSNGARTGQSTAALAAKAAPQQNPAFRMMGLPRLRLPSRNWLIFLSVTGTFASAVIYDKYQTRRIRGKWTSLVSHVADEPLPSSIMPRKMTIYLAAPPGDGLRSAREHFHDYIKPVLVAAAMDWDVVEGRKEGDVRFKTADRIRKKRRRTEAPGQFEDDAEGQLTLESVRAQSGTVEYDGVAGDIIIGRHTWKEYVRGLHEGWLGPLDAAIQPGQEKAGEPIVPVQTPGHATVVDAATKTAVQSVEQVMSEVGKGGEQEESSQSQQTGELDVNAASNDVKQEPEAEEKPKPRHPPPFIDPSEYPSAVLSSQIPAQLGPTTAVRFPHLLGFRNTPIRIYRFLNRRYLADDIGREVAAAVLASHREYSSVSVEDDGSVQGGTSVPEQVQVLAHEEKDWWKTVRAPRKEFEESVWIETMVVDDRITARMRAFQLTAEDEDRAKRLTVDPSVARRQASGEES